MQNVHFSTIEIGQKIISVTINFLSRYVFYQLIRYHEQLYIELYRNSSYSLFSSNQTCSGLESRPTTC